MKILLFGDTPGISQLLRHLPKDLIVGLVGASIRPQYIEDLQAMARSLHIPFLLQPKWRSIGYYAFIDDIQALLPDLIWVNSYSMILRPDVLAIPTKGVLNIHGALLPNNRGSNPTQWAIINRQYQTGVTLHEVDSGLDSGSIIDQISVPIGIADTWVDVRNLLVSATDDLIEANLDQILRGNWNATKQNESLATFGPRRKAEDGFFSWSEPVIDIYNKIRALLPPIPPAFYLDEHGVKQSMEVYQTLWQITYEKYKRDLLMPNVDTGQYAFGPLESEMGVNSMLKKTESLTQDYIGLKQMKELIQLPDFIPFVITAEANRSILGYVCLYNLDSKNATIQAKVISSFSVLKELDWNTRIEELTRSFAHSELGVDLKVQKGMLMQMGVLANNFNSKLR